MWTPNPLVYVIPPTDHPHLSPTNHDRKRKNGVGFVVIAMTHVLAGHLPSSITTPHLGCTTNRVGFAKYNIATILTA